MEAMVRKHDKFGWDRMNPGMRQIIREDWLAALADYPIEEVRAACRQHTTDTPDKVPNEGHIRAQIIKARYAVSQKFRDIQPPPVDNARTVSPDMAERAQAILSEVFGERANQ
jgi:hypothetical protein